MNETTGSEPVTTSGGAGRKRANPFAGPNRGDVALAAAAVLVLVLALTGLAKGYARWGHVPPIVWGHVATVLVALVLTPVILLRRRGDQRHRWLGYVWVVAMGLTAFDSLFVRVIRPGHFSLIHILSAWTLLQLVLIVRNARAGRWQQHQRSVRLMVLGALGIAGVFTLLPGRLLGHWLWG